MSEGITRIAIVCPSLVGMKNNVLSEGGITYATYLLDAGDTWVLAGTVPEWILKDWSEAVLKAAGGKTVSHMILFSETDAADAAAWMRASCPGIWIIGDAGVVHAAGADETTIEIRGARTLKLGNRQLHFLAVSGRTHWLACQDETTGHGFCGEMFSSFGAEEKYSTAQMDADEKKGWERNALLVKKYHGAAAGSMPAVLSQWNLTSLYPALGPVVDGQDLALLWKIYEPSGYESCDTDQGEKRGLSVLIAYARGMFMKTLADALYTGLRESMGEETDISLFALDSAGRNDAADRLAAADVLVLGTGSDRECVSRQLLELLPDIEAEGKKVFFFAAGFGSEPGSAGLREALATAGAVPFDNGFILTSRPEEKDLKAAAAYGFNAGCAILGVPNPRAPKLVKCLVCGEIFDAALGMCPVCGVGLDQCVPVSEDEITFRADTDREYLILGGGTAAVNAADSIRQRDRTGKITMIMQEPYLPINRPMLTKDLDAASTEEGIRLHPEEWYRERNISIITGAAACRILPEQKTVLFSDGSRRGYDKLIYAVGSEAFVPPFRGTDKEGVFTIRHVEDIAGIGQCLEKARKCVVIGGGVLGLEAAYEVFRRGVEVTVLEATPQIIGRSVDAATAQRVMIKMEGMRTRTLTGVQIEGMEGDRQVTGVRLKDGTVFQADVVIISCGSRANVQLAKEAGLETGRAVVVNSRMQTSDPDIYACGDCAELNGINYQLWSEASEQGKAAGACAAGDTVALANAPAPLTMDAFRMNLFSLGDTGRDESKHYKIIRLTDDEGEKYMTCWLCDGRVCGVTAIGFPEQTEMLRRLVTEHMTYAQLGQVLYHA